MTKKQIINLCIEDSILAGSTTFSPVRGKSAWDFVFPVRWEDFLGELKKEAVVGNELEGGIYTKPFPIYGEDLATVLLFDKEEFSFATIWENENAVTIKTAWSGFYYRFSEAANGQTALTFEGPRRAVGQQVLLPLCVQRLLGDKAKENPFHFLNGMTDAEGNWFDSDSALSFYEGEGWYLASSPGWDGWWEQRD